MTEVYVRCADHSTEIARLCRRFMTAEYLADATLCTIHVDRQSNWGKIQGKPRI